VQKERYQKVVITKLRNPHGEQKQRLTPGLYTFSEDMSAADNYFQLVNFNNTKWLEKPRRFTFSTAYFCHHTATDDTKDTDSTCQTDTAEVTSPAQIISQLLK
jgi:hypothetical protein